MIKSKLSPKYKLVQYKQINKHHKSHQQNEEQKSYSDTEKAVDTIQGFLMLKKKKEKGLHKLGIDGHTSKL